jgi:hypothetical protein
MNYFFNRRGCRRVVVDLVAVGAVVTSLLTKPSATIPRQIIRRINPDTSPPEFWSIILSMVGCNRTPRILPLIGSLITGGADIGEKWVKVCTVPFLFILSPQLNIFYFYSITVNQNVQPDRPRDIVHNNNNNIKYRPITVNND